MVPLRMFKTIRYKETSQTAMVTGSDPNKWDNLNNVRSEAIKHFWNKKRAYLKDKINKLSSYSNIKNIRGMYKAKNEFKKGYQPRTNLVKGKYDDLLADSYNIFHR
jgi:hypothetical protein